jgi:hypothetical protein
MWAGHLQKLPPGASQKAGLQFASRVIIFGTPLATQGPLGRKPMVGFEGGHG